jgi:hypothetical protein
MSELKKRIAQAPIGRILPLGAYSLMGIGEMKGVSGTPRAGSMQRHCA